MKNREERARDLEEQSARFHNRQPKRKYEHMYIMHRTGTDSFVRLTRASDHEEVNYQLEGFNGFKVYEAHSRVAP